MQKSAKISNNKSWRHNKRQYDLYAPAYDAKRKVPEFSFWNNYLDIPAVLKLLGKVPRGQTVLDMGCGTGLFTRKLAARGVNVIGLDYSTSMIAIASGRMPPGKLIVGDSCRLPIGSEAFDIVVSNLLIHYLKDLRPVFGEVNRILGPKGQFIFTFHHPIAEVADYKIKKGVVAATLSPYYHNQAYRWRMAGKMELISYHHSFENIFSSLKKSGFTVSDLVEPHPPKSAQAVNPDAFEITSRFPNFCGIKAVKLSSV
jgi:ubiquinone/menaquinone biosynthesis C-methylase UbiE